MLPSDEARVKAAANEMQPMCDTIGVKDFVVVAFMQCPLVDVKHGNKRERDTMTMGGEMSPMFPVVRLTAPASARLSSY